jgi:hypothetical protein
MINFYFTRKIQRITRSIVVQFELHPDDLEMKKAKYQRKNITISEESYD